MADRYTPQQLSVLDDLRQEYAEHAELLRCVSVGH